MSRPPTTKQAEPTQPRARDTAGRELDEWNLPLSGPARAVALEELCKPDPNTDPDAWKAADVKAAAAIETPAEEARNA